MKRYSRSHSFSFHPCSSTTDLQEQLYFFNCVASAVSPTQDFATPLCYTVGPAKGFSQFVWVGFDCVYGPFQVAKPC